MAVTLSHALPVQRLPRTMQVGGVTVPVDLVTAGWPDPQMRLEDYDPEADLMAINMGPQHPSTHGVLRVKLWLDGETVVKAIPYVGYLHRGVEKLCEKLTYVQLTPIVDKNDYVSPMMNEMAINMVIENALGIEPPRRALYMRSILAEIQRIGSHLISIGTWGLDMGGAIGGGATIFMFCMREREMLLDLFEELTGCRFHYNTHTVGGQRHDLPVGWDVKAKQVLARIVERSYEYERFLVENPICRARARGVAVLDPLLAMECGASGPILRASGVDFDLRRDAPYAAYGEIEIKVPTRTEGDALARALVRVDELRESARIASTLLDGVPEGPICALKPVKLPGAVKLMEGETAYAAVEGPRGELGSYLVAQTDRKVGQHPYRLKIRPPSLHALSLLPYLCPGHTLADVVVIIGSLDPIMGEVDR